MHRGAVGRRPRSTDRWMAPASIDARPPRETAAGAVDEPGARLGRRPAPGRRAVLRRLSGSWSTIGAATACGYRPAADRIHGVRAADDRPAGPAAPRRTRRDRRAGAGGRSPRLRRATPFLGRHPRRVPRHRPLRRPVPGQARHHAAPGHGHRRQRARVADAGAAALGARVQHDPAVARPDRDRHQARRHAGPRREPAHQRPRQRRRRRTWPARSSPPSTSSTSATHIKVTFADGSVDRGDDREPGRRERHRRPRRPTRRPPPVVPPRSATRPPCTSAARRTSSATRSACTAR